MSSYDVSAYLDGGTRYIITTTNDLRLTNESVGIGEAAQTIDAIVAYSLECTESHLVYDEGDSGALCELQNKAREVDQVAFGPENGQIDSETQRESWRIEDQKIYEHLRRQAVKAARKCDE